MSEELKDFKELKIEETDFTDGEFLLNELKQMKKSLGDCPKSILQRIVDTQLKSEKEALLELYEKEVAHLPKTDPVKLEILNLMLWIGINPFDSMNIKETLKLG